MFLFRVQTAVVVFVAFVSLTLSDAARAFGAEPTSAPHNIAVASRESPCTELSVDCCAEPEMSCQIGGWNPAHHKKRLSLKATLIIVGIVVGAVYVLGHVLVPYT